MLHLFNIFHENDGKENCAQVLEEELHRMLGIKYVNDEHDCNVVSMNSLNTRDANDMQSHKLGDAMFDEDYMLVDHEKNALCAGYIVEFIHDATENYYVHCKVHKYG